ETQFRVRGSLHAPQIHVSCTSPRLEWGQTALNKVHIAAQTPACNIATQEAQGTLTLNSNLQNVGAMTFATVWSYQQAAFAVRDVLFSAPGLRVSGALEARFPAKHPPRLDGTLTTSLDNGTTLSTLANTPLASGASKLRLTLDTKSGTQHLNADWSCADLRQEALSLKKLAGQLDVQNLFGKPTILLDTTLGAGAIKELNWTGGTLRLRGALHELHASATLQGRTRAD
ncbi:MAG: hypothetical protein RR014_07045, partial [Bilophila sp.]